MKRLLPLLAILLPGCGGAPPRQDPFANIELPSAAANYKNVTIAVIISENTKRALQHARESGAALDGKVDAEKIFEDFADLFRRHFGKAVRANGLPDAERAGADLAVVLDVYAKVPTTVMQQAQIDASAIFLTVDGKKIEEVSATASKTVHIMGIERAATTIDLVAGQARRELERRLLDSPKVSEFARFRAGAMQAAAATGASRKAAKSYVSDVDVPRYKLAEDPDKVAVVIGVEDYESLPSADFAERDADAVREHLAALGFAPRNTAFLVGSKAGKAGIEKHLESWLPSRVTPNSRVVVYFSGHGAPDVKTGQAYLVPWDGDPKFLETTGYPLKRLYRTLGSLKAKSIVLAMDSCFSGAGGRSVIPKGTRPLVAKVDEAAPSGPVAVLAASGGDEISGSDQTQGHGLFTYHLLKGLAATEGRATVKALYEYLAPKVQDAARGENRDQSPKLILPPEAAEVTLR